MPCFGHCDRTPGNCSFCGTGQCCRKTDYNNDVPGCELASDVRGSECGYFRGEVGLKNEGGACWGHCGSKPGNCSFCGTGQCCRQVDGERCEPGCELAGSVTGGAQCGNFVSSAGCVPVSSGSPAGSPTTPPESTSAPTPDATGLLHGGQPCLGQCGFQGGNCTGYCVTGQCCSSNDWYRGVPGCELAQNVTTGVCGHFSQPHPEPAEFRLPPPLGTARTPPAPPSQEPSPNSSASWLRDIVAAAQDDELPNVIYR